MGVSRIHPDADAGGRRHRRVRRQGQPEIKTPQFSHCVGFLPAQAPALPVPACTAVDARMGWKPQRQIEFSLSIENLLDREHAEFTTASRYGRSVFLKALWRL